MADEGNQSIQEHMMNPLFKDKEYSLIFNEKMTVKVEEGEQTFNISVYQYNDENGASDHDLRIELTKEDDIYYIACAKFTKESFAKNFKGSKGKKDLKELVENFEKIVKYVNENRTVYSAILDDMTLQFKQKLQYKTVKLFSITFEKINPEEDEYVFEQAQFRFDEKAAQLGKIETDYDLLCQTVAKMNKQLYNQLMRGQEFNATRSMK